MAAAVPPGTDLSMVPAGMPPPGVAPRFHDPPSLTPTLIGLCVFLIVWGTSFAAIRVWINRSKLGIGDVFVVIGVVLAIAYCSILLSFAHYFRHSWDIPLSWYTPTYIKVLLYAQNVLLGPTIFFSKEAIFLLYFEIFQVKKRMRLAIVFGMIFTGVAYWPGVIITSILCAARVGETWDPLAGVSLSMRCQKSVYWGIVQGACAISIDVLIFVLPIPIVMKLQLSTRRKVQILGVFMTAFMGILASVFAEVYRVRLLTRSDDQSWQTAQQLICVIVENWVAVVVSCMPAFAKFCRLYIAEPHPFTPLLSRLSSWIGSARSTLNKPLHRSDSSHMESQEGLRPPSPSNAAPYYQLQERTPAGGARSGTV